MVVLLYIGNGVVFFLPNSEYFQKTKFYICKNFIVTVLFLYVSRPVVNIYSAAKSQFFSTVSCLTLRAGAGAAWLSGST